MYAYVYSLCTSLGNVVIFKSVDSIQKSSTTAVMESSHMHMESQENLTECFCHWV
jgi:hypothetical protein